MQDIHITRENRKLFRATMFINFSNHPSGLWSDTQKEAALALCNASAALSDVFNAKIEDIPFPVVPSEASAGDIHALADEYIDKIMRLKPDAVMCQGEFTFAYAVISKLKSRGITVVAACTNREAVETQISDTVHKTSVFEFVQFREYL